MKSKLLILLIPAFLLLPLVAESMWPPSNWIYQLQDVDISELTTLGPDVVVIDYSSDGTEDGEWTTDHIQHLKNAGITPICYFSIGEAEDYRFYWQEEWSTNPPDWMGPENPDWEGNYKVKFWREGWRNILFGIETGEDVSYLDRIIDMGFEGIYLDIVDAYYYWSEEAPVTYLNAPTDMVTLIHDLAIYARETRGMGEDFIVLPQNGEFIVYDAPPGDVEIYYSVVSGIGVEDVFHPGDLDENNSFDPDTERLEILSEFISLSKPVLSVDYLTQLSLIENYYNAAQEEGFIPLATTRELDTPTWYPEYNSVDESQNLLPETLEITVYPNPFNGSMRYSFSVVEPSNFLITLHNLAGQRVEVLFNGKLDSGIYEFSLEKQDLSSGTYFLSATGDKISGYKKIQLLR